MTDDAPLPADSHVGRVALRVNDLDEVADFYEQVVGLELLEQTADRVRLGAGGATLLELVADPDAPARGRREAGLFHTAFLVPDRAALGDALGRIEEDGDLTGASDHRVSEALYLQDPEGNGVEIYRDRPQTDWPVAPDGTVEMDTLPLELAPLREAAAGDDSVPAETVVGHIHLEVSSLDDAEAFYADALGLDVRQRWNDAALFLAAGDYHHNVGCNVWNARTAPHAGRGLAWFELVVPDAHVLDAVRDRFATAGYEVTDTEDGIAVVDPDDITVRVRAEPTD